MKETINDAPRPPYGILSVLMIGAFIAFLNNTLLNIALPSIMIELEIDTATVQWLTTGFMLVNGVMIPATAFLIEKYTVRRLFLVAMGLFTIGTVISGMAHTFPVLLGGRMLQASGSAIMMPLLMNVMLAAFPVEKRGAAMGSFGIVMITAPAIGPTLSGWLVEHYSWRMLFDVVLPIALLTLVISIFKLKDVTGQRSIKLDILSLILSSIGFGGLLYGFSNAGDRGWDDPVVYGTIIAGAIGLILFIIRQLKMDEPMLEFRIYKYPMFALSSAIAIVIAVAMFSAMILMPIYVQTIRGISPIDSGLLMLPGAIVMGIMSPITGRLFDKYGARALAVIGLTITVVTSYFFSKISMDTAYSTLVLLYTFRMFGMSMVMMPVMTNGLNQLPAINNPHGTAMNNTLQQVSGAIGSALLVSVMNNRRDDKIEDLLANGAGNVEAGAQQAGSIPLDVLHEGMLAGINFSFFVSTLIACLALILALFIKRVKPPHQQDAETKIEAKKIAVE